MTKTQPTHKKLPRGCIKKLLHEDYWMAVIPCHAPAQASQIVRAAEFLRLSREEQVDNLARALHGGSWTFDVGPDDSRHVYYDNARAVLAAMGMGGAK